MNDEEEPLAEANRQLFASLRRVDLPTGVRPVQAPRECCERLHASLLRGFEAGVRNGCTGALYLSAAGRSNAFWGFENYDRVQAVLDRSEQRKVTTMLPVHELEEVGWQELLYKGLDGLEELIAFAKTVADGHTLLACHMLRQDSRQACFAWHQDDKNNPHTKLSVVFLLSPTQSTVSGTRPQWRASTEPP